MDRQGHFDRLEKLYLSAPINEIYQPSISISDGECIVEIDVSEKLFHGFGAVHGSVYFKMLDDAAYFAANSLEQNVFLVTTTFTTYMTRPVSSGRIRAVGKVLNYNRSQFISEAVIYNSTGKEIGRGNGIFVRSKAQLDSNKP